ncbi:FtsX-like permease family protein [Corynebacterium lowii]|uniref:FtsX-like permease family protein n=1 Tax=Corynebacterium lowii TaxID=1544413 RepID=A0A0Q0UI59_9CORY|nr:FtsX-like permease family protein [Corynebacterium lowii]KQB86047.1 FtsX-like permease family protein [Corynebacterium lowii]MDP9850522.1 hypothetical protein [Corynebacterium lowii]
MTNLRMPARIAWRDITSHRARSIVAVLFFALPIALVTLAGFTLSSADWDADNTRKSWITLSSEGEGTDLERIRAVLPEEELIAETTARTILTAGDTTAYMDVRYSSTGDDTLGLTSAVAEALGVREGDSIEIQAPWEQEPRALPVSFDTNTQVNLHYPLDEIVSAVFPSRVSWHTPAIVEVATPDVEVSPLHSMAQGSPVPLLKALSGGSAITIASAVTMGLLGLIVLAAMISPIFAVAARRQFHTMRLLSINGAAPSQLRWSLYLEALMVAAVGIGLGLLLGIAAFLLIVPRIGWDLTGFVIPIDLLFLTIASGLFCALAAAVIPAVQASRLRPELSARLRWRWPMSIGPIIAAVSLVVILLPTDVAILGYGFFGIGIVTSTPALLWLLSHWAARGPVALRLALRDLFRQVHRTAPAIAAIVGLSFVLGVISIGNTYVYQNDPSEKPQIAVHPHVYLEDSSPIEQEAQEVANIVGGATPIYIRRAVENDELAIIEPSRLREYLRHASSPTDFYATSVQSDATEEEIDTAIEALERGETVELSLLGSVTAPRDGLDTYLDTAYIFPQQELSMGQEVRLCLSKQDFTSIHSQPDHLGRVVEHYLFPLVLLSLACLAVMIMLAALSVGETRADLTTMWAVGAPPRLLSRISALQSLLIAALGVAVGLASALFLYVFTDIKGIGEVPWLLWLLLLVVVPLVGWASGGITAAASRKTQSRQR